MRFTIGSECDIRQAAHLQIFNNSLYDESLGQYAPALFGPLDARLAGLIDQLILFLVAGNNPSESSMSNVQPVDG